MLYMHDKIDGVKLNRVQLKTNIFNDLSAGLSVKDTAIKNNVTRLKIYKLLSKNKIKTKNVSQITNIENKKEAIKDFVQKFISELPLVLQEPNNLKIKQNYTIDQGFLDKMNHSYCFYFLGFFMADGHNHKNYEGFTIKLHPKDDEILSKFKKIMHSNHTIRYNLSNKSDQKYATFLVYNRHISLSLLKLGADHNKTKNLTFPNYIPKEFLSDFIRGYFDGDGCFYVQKESSSGAIRNASFSLVGQKPFLDGVKSVFESIGIRAKYGSVPEARKNHKYSSLVIHGNKNVIKVMDFLYRNRKISLSRKREHFMDWLSEYLYKKNLNDLNKEPHEIYNNMVNFDKKDLESQNMS
jgi:intein/homing endonuclease